MADSRYLIDTNILLRLFEREHPAYPICTQHPPGISHTLTFNGKDFARYLGITAIHPESVGK